MVTTEIDLMRIFITIKRNTIKDIDLNAKEQSVIERIITEDLETVTTIKIEDMSKIEAIKKVIESQTTIKTDSIVKMKNVEVDMKKPTITETIEEIKPNIDLKNRAS